MSIDYNGVLKTIFKEVNEIELNKFKFKYDTVYIGGIILTKVWFCYFAK